MESRALGGEKRGLFVTFEGLDGSGKSTQIGRLRAELPDGVFVREPGGTAVGERIRDLVLHGPAMTPEAEMYLYMAARAELLRDVIEPALASGRLVVDDRYHDSTIAYQGGGRGLDVSWPSGFRRPDRTYLLALPAELGLGRGLAGRGADRLEAEPLEFHRAVSAAYDRIAAAEPGRYLRLDATLPPDELHRRIAEDIRHLLSGARGKQPSRNS
jgi:dTMP kinase